MKLRGTASGNAQTGPSCRIVAGMISIRGGMDSLSHVAEGEAEEDVRVAFADIAIAFELVASVAVMILLH